MLKIITSFQEDMQAEVRIGGVLTEFLELGMAYVKGALWNPHCLISLVVLWCLPGGLIVFKLV